MAVDSAASRESGATSWATQSRGATVSGRAPPYMDRASA